MTIKTLNIKLPGSVFREIETRSKKAGCSHEDFVKKSLELALFGYSDFDFQGPVEVDDEN